MAAHGVHTIVVGVDGSANSAEAVRFTAGLAGALGAEVVAVHALGLLDQLEPDGPRVPTQPHRDEIAEKVRGEWVQALADAGIAHRAVMHDGNPVDVVLQTATEEGADLVVVGSRGIGASPVMLLGSTSTQVAQRCTCPVTIVPSAQRATGGEG
jgi:nucleotide-binding universal stress UspA family protein